MLVPSMNFDELKVEANSEYDVLIKSSTIQRLTLEYVSERLKNKVKRNESHPLFYTIKSKKKNNWLIMIRKKDTVEYISSPDDFNSLCMLYYHSDKGLRIILTVPSRVISIYNEHLFTRYKERMHLDLSGTLEIAKHYFERNYVATFQSFPQEENIRGIIGLVSNGFALGEMHFINSNIIMYYKTFISRETASMKHAKSLFELEKIYRSNEDEESKQFYDTLGFDDEGGDNTQFFAQWDKLRNGIIEDQQQEMFFTIISEEEQEKNRIKATKSKE